MIGPCAMIQRRNGLSESGHAVAQRLALNCFKRREKPLWRLRPTIVQNLAKEAFNLTLQIVRPAGVRHYIIGSPTLLVKWHLRFFPLCPLGVFPPSSGLTPPLTLLRRGIDENHRITLLIQSRLEQQRSIDDQSRCLRRRIGELLAPSLLDPRMRELFEPFPLGGIVENNPRDLGSIDLALRIENLIAPPSAKGVFDAGIAQRRPPRSIGINDQAAQLGKDRRDRGLARSNAAGETDDGGLPIDD